jgi:hypothetical protein
VQFSTQNGQALIHRARICWRLSVLVYESGGRMVRVHPRTHSPRRATLEQLLFTLVSGEETALELAQREMQVQLGAALITRLLFGGSLTAYQLSRLAAALIGAQYPRDKEFEADHYGVIYAKKAGFDQGVPVFFRATEAAGAKARSDGHRLR